MNVSAILKLSGQDRAETVQGPSSVLFKGRDASVCVSNAQFVASQLNPHDHFRAARHLLGCHHQDFEVQERPWGGYVNLDRVFARPDKTGPCKYLIIIPGQQLSWQYHNRRAEEWVVMTPCLEVQTSADDSPAEWQPVRPGDVLFIPAGRRHTARNVGVSAAVIAEMWINTADSPSDEQDIVRVHDVYGR